MCCMSVDCLLCMSWCNPSPRIGNEKQNAVGFVSNSYAMAIEKDLDNRNDV